jgi:hypothetical protein
MDNDEERQAGIDELKAKERELEDKLERLELELDPETREQAICRAAQRLALVRELDELKDQVKQHTAEVQRAKAAVEESGRGMKALPLEVQLELRQKLEERLELEPKREAVIREEIAKLDQWIAEKDQAE